MTLPQLRREIVAGVVAAFVALPICLSSGVLAYAPLGEQNIARGALAGLYGGAFAAIFATLVASPSFVISSPRASISLIQASLAAWLLQNRSFAADPELIITAMSLCVLLAGVWQMLFSLLGIERIIKSTPHPVLAGFISGIGLLVVFNQLQLLFNVHFGGNISDLVALFDMTQPGRPVFAVAVAAFILYLSARTKGAPAAAVGGLALGIALFYAVRAVVPDAALGSTIGDVPGHLSVGVPFAALMSATARQEFLSVTPALLLTSLILALVAALESLLAFRVAQDLSDLPAQPSRGVFGQGVGNIVSAFVGGLAASASASQVTANYRAGGRSRLSALTAAVLLLLISTLLTSVLAVIPIVVIWAILLAIGILLFDRWILHLVRDVLFHRPRTDMRRAWKNLSVAAVVTAIVASGAVIGGTLVGIALSCLVFIIDMSRSIVRRRFRGDQIFSKRVRPTGDVAMLRRTGRRRAILEVQGPMFFGNADDLSREVKLLFDEVDMIVVDLKGITDIDISAANILRQDISKSLRRGKRLLLCSVPAAHLPMLTAAEDAPPVPPSMIFDDLDTALEWMEEQALREEVRSASAALPLGQHDLLRGLGAGDLAVITAFLTPQSYRAGAIICSEGDEADGMWILTRGSVSVRLQAMDHLRTRRIASLAAGTTVGELSLIEGGHRSATVVADEDVECHMLGTAAFEAILRDHPQIGIGLMGNLIREMARRVRATSDDLRAANG